MTYLKRGQDLHAQRQCDHSRAGWPRFWDTNNGNSESSLRTVDSGPLLSRYHVLRLLEMASTSTVSAASLVLVLYGQGHGMVAWIEEALEKSDGESSGDNATSTSVLDGSLAINADLFLSDRLLTISFRCRPRTFPLRNFIDSTLAIVVRYYKPSDACNSPKPLIRYLKIEMRWKKRIECEETSSILYPRYDIGWVLRICKPGALWIVSASLNLSKCKGILSHPCDNLDRSPHEERNNDDLCGVAEYPVCRRTLGNASSIFDANERVVTSVLRVRETISSLCLSRNRDLIMPEYFSARMNIQGGEKREEDPVTASIPIIARQKSCMENWHRPPTSSRTTLKTQMRYDGRPHLIDWSFFTAILIHGVRERGKANPPRPVNSYDLYAPTYGDGFKRSPCQHDSVSPSWLTRTNVSCTRDCGPSHTPWVLHRLYRETIPCKSASELRFCDVKKSVKSVCWYRDRWFWSSKRCASYVPP